MADNNNPSGGQGAGFGSFAAKKMLAPVAAMVAVMAALWIGIQYYGAVERDQQAPYQAVATREGDPADARTNAANAPVGGHAADDEHAATPAPAMQATVAGEGHSAAADPAMQTVAVGGDHAAAAAPAVPATKAGDYHAAATAPATQAIVVATDDHDAETAMSAPAASSEDGYHEAVENGDHGVDKSLASEESDSVPHAAVNGKAHAPADNDAAGHGQPSEEAAAGHGGGSAKTYPALGMAFVDALIEPMDYELNHRFFGWRRNDIIEYTDNINNFQLGILEVTRRTTRILAERIARTGSTARFDPHLENAMNWFMIKADRYWFPSAESKYKDGLKELRAYYENLALGEAEFYNRTDNLIPLLAAYRDLLGSCDENLVKTHEIDGSEVSFFKSDDYFFYAKGVASALHTILISVEKDFHNAMATREGSLEVLHHAIESCHHALQIEPWFILNSDYGSIWANHRANMAAPISHAYFYIGVLIKTLST